MNIRIQEFAYVTDGACTEEEILQMELVVLKGLNWGLSPMTPNSWMRMFMQISSGDMSPHNDSFILPAYSGLPFSKTMQLLDLCVLDLGSLEFTYSVLATSALYHTQNEALALHVSGYQWKDIASCVRWMSAFAFALRESCPLQPRFYPQIHPDDAHHIQSHSVDLDIWRRARLGSRSSPRGQTEILQTQRITRLHPPAWTTLPRRRQGTSCIRQP